MWGFLFITVIILAILAMVYIDERPHVQFNNKFLKLIYVINGGGGGVDLFCLIDKKTNCIVEFSCAPYHRDRMLWNLKHNILIRTKHKREYIYKWEVSLDGKFKLIENKAIGSEYVYECRIYGKKYFYTKEDNYVVFT